MVFDFIVQCNSQRTKSRHLLLCGWPSSYVRRIKTELITSGILQCSSLPSFERHNDLYHARCYRPWCHFPTAWCRFLWRRKFTDELSHRAPVAQLIILDLLRAVMTTTSYTGARTPTAQLTRPTPLISRSRWPPTVRMIRSMSFLSLSLMCTRALAAYLR